MRLKTYFSSGVEAAIHLARTELGPEAMLVHSKKTTGEGAALGAYEVVFALSNENDQPPAKAPGERIAEQPRAEAPPSADLARLREAVEMTLRLTRRSEALLNAQYRLAGEYADLAAVLEEAGFTLDFRIRMLQELRETAPSAIRSKAVAWLQKQTRSQHQLGKPGAPRKCVVLIGPPGAGKSVTLVKIAAKYGITGRRPAQFLSLDSERIGGADTLKAYAGVLGIGLQVLDSLHGLSQALAEHANKDLILIDTPGLSIQGATQERDLAGFLSGRQDLDKHLVLPATMSTATLKRYIGAYAAFAPDKLLFTRLDEAEERYGPILETAIEAGIPLSLCGAGQRTPEDLETSDPALYCEKILPAWLSPETEEQSKQAAA